MIRFSGTLKNPNFDGNTIFLQCEDSKYVYNPGLEILEFTTDDKNLDYISLMGTIVIPYSFAVGDKKTYFISTQHKVIENDRIEEDMLLSSTNGSLDPYDYHLSKNGLDCFKKLLESIRTHSSWLNMEIGVMEEIVEDEEDDEEDGNIHELEYTDGSKEVVKVFNQKCVLCLERDSDSKFKQCGHQCICGKYYQNKGNFDILKSVICRKKIFYYKNGYGICCIILSKQT